MNENPRFPLSDDVRRMKISMVGDMATGKTCLCLRFVKNLYTSCHRATVSDIETKVVQLQNDHVIYQIWDTAGQERFRSLLPMYLRGIDGAIVVYDITDKKTYENVQGWVTEVRKYSDASTVIMLVGNKLDLVEENSSLRKTEAETVRSWCKFHDILFYEASAKTGENVRNAFIALGEEIIKRSEKRSSNNNYEDKCIDMSKQPQTSRLKCCHR